MADLKYTQRDAASIFAGMMADAKTKTPEWTNFNDTELGVAILRVLAGSLDVLSYSMDNNALETFLDSAIVKENVQALLRGIGYEMPRRKAATVLLRFTLNQTSGAPITIPAGTIVQTDAGTQFVTHDDAVIPAGSLSPLADVLAYEGTFHSETFSSNGQDDQTIALGFSDVADNFLDIYVDGVLWTEEKKIDPFPSTVTTIYRAVEDFDNATSLRFSKYLGQAPTVGQSIEARYVSTNAGDGNIGAGLITTIISTITLPVGYTLTVANPAQASGGAERESVLQAKVNGPRSLRSLNRAVTVQDFVDILAMQPGIDNVQVIDHAGFEEIYVRLAKISGVYPQMKIEAPVQIAPVVLNTGGTIAKNQTIFVGVTSVDANGRESNTRVVTSSTGQVKNNPVSIGIPNAGADTYSLGIQLTATPLGVASFNVYVGLTSTTMYRVNGSLLTPAQIVSAQYTVTAIPGSGTLAPTKNLAGTQNPLTGRSYYADLFDLLEAKRLLCTSCDLFNPVAVPQNVTAIVTVKDNFKQSDVQTAVKNTIIAYFDARPIGEPLYISDLENDIFSSVTGVKNVSVIVPGDDVVFANGEYAVLNGDPVLQMRGGLV